ncbi:hypothetical protein [Streptomyces sp. x-80]|uniref:hypothetical protein n=1 Tax=Streptomyces sp. x-80 TaxID=2789282 RepID=UPI00398139AD
MRVLHARIRRHTIAATAARGPIRWLHLLGVTTPSDTPTAHDLARALADQIHPDAAPRDVIVSFRVRPQAAAKFGHRSRGGPVTVFAQALHAHLFGLPADTGPLPTALDALLQATHAATSPEQKTAILQQLADQLRNAIAIIQGYQYAAQWDQLPNDIAEQLRHAHDQAQQVAETLDRVAPALSSRPSTEASPGPQPQHPHVLRAATPATALAPPAGRRR